MYNKEDMDKVVKEAIDSGNDLIANLKLCHVENRILKKMVEALPVDDPDRLEAIESYNEMIMDAYKYEKKKLRETLKEEKAIFKAFGYDLQFNEF